MNAHSLRLFAALAAAAAVIAWPLDSHAQGAKKKNPASKLYVSDVAGEAEIDTGDVVEDLSKRSVYTAQGTVIDTKQPEADDEKDKHYSTMVFSNGTGAFFDADTRVEVRRFVQEPFVPTRSDNEVEPSISQTQAFVARGTVGLCTSKLVAGSTMNYSTAHGSVNIQGRKVVIEARADETRIAMLEGESTVRAGTLDMGGHTIKAGEQAIIRPGPPGQPNIIEVAKIPDSEMPKLDDKVAMACMAKRTVYFDVRNRGQQEGSDVDAFDTQADATRNAGGPFVSESGEIVAIPVVPATPPVQFTVSPSRLITPNGNVVTPGNGNGNGPSGPGGPGG